MKRKIFLCVIATFSMLMALAQLTTKDFKICLDNVTCTGSILKITKAQLLQSKKIIPNFSWFTITSTIVYIGEGNWTSEITPCMLNADQFTNNCRKLFERLNPGALVTIVPVGHNKQNKPVEWSPLSIIIKE